VQNDFTLPGTSSTAPTDKRRVTRITAARDSHPVWTTMLDPSVAVLSANESAALIDPRDEPSLQDLRRVWVFLA
jgi:hypothetical protein